MAVDVAVNVKLAAPGEFSFQHQLALQDAGGRARRGQTSCAREIRSSNVKRHCAGTGSTDAR